MRHDSHRVSPFGYFRFKACLAAPRNFSQPTTSFIGILCQGIHYVRLINFLRYLNKLRYASTSYWYLSPYGDVNF